MQVPSRRPELPSNPPLSEQTLALLTAAQHEALVSQEYVGTEHVLSAVLHSVNSAELLRRCGMDCVQATAMLYPVLVPQLKSGAALRERPLTTRVYRAFEHAAQHARAREARAIAVPDVLLGLLQDATSPATQVMTASGLESSLMTEAAWATPQ